MAVRNWSPSPRVRAWSYLGIGLLLVLNPFYLDPLGLGEERYEYRAVPVTPTPDGLHFEERPPSEIVRVEGIDCYLEEPPPAECVLQAGLADGENHTTVTSGASEGAWESFVYIDETFYRRSYRGEAVGDGRTRVTTRYRPVSPRTFLEDVSVDVAALHEPHRHVVEDDRLRVDDPLQHEPALGPNTYEPSGRFVAADGGYYLLGLEHYDPGLANRGLYSAASVLLGVVSLGMGFRLRGRESPAGRDRD